jgi:glycosyltransferase involved in cell wall biosynthesis
VEDLPGVAGGEKEAVVVGEEENRNCGNDYDNDSEDDYDYDYEHEQKLYAEPVGVKVLVATNMYPTEKRPYLGIFVREQVESLRAIGCEVDVAAHVAEDTRWMYWKGLWALRRRMRRENYDLIHSHHTYSTVLALVARQLEGRASGERRLPIVMTFHESEIFRRGVDYGQDPLRRLKYSMRLKSWALRGADRVIAVQRKMVGRVLGEAAGEVMQTVIPAGIDLERFAPGDRGAARRRMDWPEAGVCVLFPCDPAKPEKRADLAQSGFELWKQTLPPAERELAWLELGGGIDYGRMPDAIRACNVVLTPTDYEASPTVIKEALACERPVVSTDVGDVREAYGGLAGVRMCDWTAESVAAALRDALAVEGPFGGRERLIERGLGLEQVARQVEGIYREVLGTESRTS